MKIHGTAKGGAISKKDFGVAFSSNGGGGVVTWIPNVSGTAGTTDWAPTKARGFQVTSGNPLINNLLSTVAFKLSKIDNGGIPDFDLYIKLYSSSGAIRETSTNSFNTSTLDGSPTFKTFTFDGDVTIDEDDVIALWRGSEHLLHVLQYKYADSSDTTWTPVTIIPDSSPVTVTGYPETKVNE